MSTTLIIVYILIGLACVLLLATFVGFIIYVKRKRWLHPKDEPHSTMRKQQYAKTTVTNTSSLTKQRKQKHLSTADDVVLHLEPGQLNHSFATDVVDGDVDDLGHAQLVTDGKGRVYTLTRSTNGSMGARSLGGRSARSTHASRAAPYDTVSLTLSNLRLAEVGGDEAAAAVHRSAPQGLAPPNTNGRPHTSASSYPERYRRRRNHPSAVHGTRSVGGGVDDLSTANALGEATAYYDPSAASLHRPNLYSTSTDNVFLNAPTSARDFESVSRASSYAPNH